MFEECRLDAEKNGYVYFGIQYWGECWGSFDAEMTYRKHGCHLNCLRNNENGYGIGTDWSNFVYRQKKGTILIYLSIHTKLCASLSLSQTPQVLQYFLMKE